MKLIGTVVEVICFFPPSEFQSKVLKYSDAVCFSDRNRDEQLMLFSFKFSTFLFRILIGREADGIKILQESFNWNPGKKMMAIHIIFGSRSKLNNQKSRIPVEIRILEKIPSDFLCNHSYVQDQSLFHNILSF